jgi:deoxyribonuclease V
MRVRPLVLPEGLADAAALQRRLARRVRATGGGPRPLSLVAGVDCSPAPDGRLVAAAVLLEGPPWRVVGEAFARGVPTVPYVPGFLSFREAPLVLEALSRLRATPHALLVDGHGVAHPRGLGIAAHVGLHVGVPTVGVAKHVFVGTHGPLGPEAGDRAPLRHEGRTIGVALRTRRGVKPVYVSVGHRVSLRAAVAIALRTTSRYRLPDPVREADLRSRRDARGS